MATALLVGAVACSSPEAQRSRSGGLGADIGNRGDVPQPAVAPSPPPSIPVTSTPVASPAAAPVPSPSPTRLPGDFPEAKPTQDAGPPTPTPLPGAPASPTVRPSG
jgi:hypothetical protein